MSALPPFKLADGAQTGSLVILCRRRTGARAIYDLLANHSQHRLLGNDPFRWDQPLGDVSRLFHEHQQEKARGLLLDALASGVMLRHCYETESWGLNQLLLQAMAATGTRAIVFERQDEAERLFSLAMALQHGLWGRASIDDFRERLRRGAPIEPFEPEWLVRLVQAETAYRRWFDAQLELSRISVLPCTHEQLFRSGIRALGLADQIFAFAGLGSRVAQLDDASLLRVAFSGEHHTLGLLDYSEPLRSAYELICSELAQPTPTEEPAAAAPAEPAPPEEPQAPAQAPEGTSPAPEPPG